MFFQQLHNFGFRVGRDARLAHVNVELEQSAHTIDGIFADCFVQRSLAVKVDRVLIDAVQRTQQLARARLVIQRCEMQRRPTFFVKEKKISVMKQQRHFQKKIVEKTDPSLFRSFPVAPQAISVSGASVHPREAVPCIGCSLIKRHEARLKRADNSKIIIKFIQVKARKPVAVFCFDVRARFEQQTNNWRVAFIAGNMKWREPVLQQIE